MERGYVSVYGRNDIKQGAFVSVSEDYLRHVGGAKSRYSKVVPLDDILWIDSLSGIYASEEEGIPISPGEYVRVNDPILAAISRAVKDGLQDGNMIIVYNGGYNYYCTVNSVEGFIYKIERKASNAINLKEIRIEMGVSKDAFERITKADSQRSEASGSIRGRNDSGSVRRNRHRGKTERDTGVDERARSFDEFGIDTKNMPGGGSFKVRRAKGSRDEACLASASVKTTVNNIRAFENNDKVFLQTVYARQEDGSFVLLPLRDPFNNRFANAHQAQ